MRLSEPPALAGLVVAAVTISAWRPYDAATWVMEVLPIFVAVPVLALTRRRFPLSPPTYRLLTLWALVLALGGHYTYARVPLGFWLGDVLGWSRNNYDRIAHFLQGAIPAILFRELLLRTSTLRRGPWLFVVAASMCVALSAGYEFIEWWAAIAMGSEAREFLGTQGDVWDTQWDMLMALLGAVSSLLVLAGAHDRALRRMPATAPAAKAEPASFERKGDAKPGRDARAFTRREPQALLVLVLAAFAVSAWRPFEAETWLMEMLPALLIAAGLVAGYRRFPLTSLSYRLLALSAVTMAVGAHYSYARVPLGFWFSEAFGLARNHYDRFGHVLQGVVPAVALREVLLRRTTLRPGLWLFVAVCTMTLTLSVFYEFVEWWAALAFGDGAVEFLGTQGDPWDAQWDMLLALLGAVAAQFAFSRGQDAELRRLRLVRTGRAEQKEEPGPAPGIGL